MKIGILTHPIQGNYGGMLQAFALQTALEQFGHHTELLKYAFPPKYGLFNTTLIHTKYHIRKLQYSLGLKIASPPVPPFVRYRIAKEFEKKFLHVSPLAPVKDIEKNKIRFNYDAWVVGSDQVWRASYVRSMASLPFFFLNFIPQQIRQRSISYAASFGTDLWEGTPQETEECRQLLSQFKAVSSREFGGIKICNEIFERACEQMPDPAFLIKADNYEYIIEKEKLGSIKKNYIAAYILDETPEKRFHIHQIASCKHMEVREIINNCTVAPYEDRTPCSVGQWLRHLRDAQLVITDSFHGCVFSMIFNKPFICLGNSDRGMERFESLFKMLGKQNEPFGTIHEITEKKLAAIAAQGKKYLQRNLPGHE